MLNRVMQSGCLYQRMGKQNECSNWRFCFDKNEASAEAQEENLTEVVDRYSPLVKRIAHHLLLRMPASVQIDDLIQSGMIGLLEAAKKYDVSKGASFETYAGIRIRGSMLDEVRKGDWAPRSVHRKSRKVAEAIKAIEARTGKMQKMLKSPKKWTLISTPTMRFCRMLPEPIIQL